MVCFCSSEERSVASQFTHQRSRVTALRWVSRVDIMQHLSNKNQSLISKIFLYVYLQRFIGFNRGFMGACLVRKLKSYWRSRVRWTGKNHLSFLTYVRLRCKVVFMSFSPFSAGCFWFVTVSCTCSALCCAWVINWRRNTTSSFP